jgi:hypothetical protein
MKLHLTSRPRLVCIAIGIAVIAGCSDHPTLLPNPDKNLRLTTAQFAADAAKRHPYKDDAPRGGTIAARAEVDYGVSKIEIANLSDAAWDNVEVWVNKNWVVFVPHMETGSTKVLPFSMMFDDSGNPLHADSGKSRVASIEICRDGKYYEVTKQLAD